MTRLDELHTPRLILTRLRAQDLDDIARMHSDERVMATLGGVRSKAQTAEAHQRQMAHWDAHGFGWWAARDAMTKEFVGRGGLRHAMVEARDEIELGYGLTADFWGKGLATELARESVRVGFEVLQLPELVSFTLPTNHVSRRVMEKAGFRYERDFTHADLPHVLYRLTQAAWRTCR